MPPSAGSAADDGETNNDAQTIAAATTNAWVAGAGGAAEAPVHAAHVGAPPGLPFGPAPATRWSPFWNSHEFRSDIHCWLAPTHRGTHNMPCLDVIVQAELIGMRTQADGVGFGEQRRHSPSPGPGRSSVGPSAPWLRSQAWRIRGSISAMCAAAYSAQTAARSSEWAQTRNPGRPLVASRRIGTFRSRCARRG